MKIRTSPFLAAAFAAAVAIAGLAVVPATAHDSRSDIALPNGFAPEDIAVGRHHTFFVGSLATGAIYRGDLRSGEGAVLAPGGTPPSVGLFFEKRSSHQDRLWAAGGPSGALRVYDANTGALLTSYQLADPTAGAFVNDLVVKDGTAYVTDSFLPRLYVIPLGSDGSLPAPAAVRTVPLTGDVAYTTSPNAFNLNGLAVIDGTLLSAQTNTGRLFAIDPATGVTTAVDLVDDDDDPTTIFGADGIAQRGNRLFVALNFPNKIAILKVRDHGARAEVRETLSDLRLDIPTSVAVDRGRLYAVNARFTTAPGPSTAYSLTVLKP